MKNSYETKNKREWRFEKKKNVIGTETAATLISFFMKQRKYLKIYFRLS